MSKRAIIWIVIGGSLVLIGAMIFAGVMTMFNWDFKKLSTVQYVTNDYDITEEYKSILIDSDTADIVLVASTDGKTTVNCYERDKEKHFVTVVDGVLNIELTDTRKWYEHIGIGFGAPKIKVSLPAGEYSSLFVKEHTGEVEISSDFSFESIDITATTGNVENFASASGIMRIKTSTGHILVERVSAGAIDLSVTTGNITASKIDCDGGFKVEVDTGKTNLSDIRCESLISEGDTGDINLKNVVASGKFSIERSTGDVKLDGSDAGQLFIKTDTGDVKLDGADAGDIFIKTHTGDVTGTLLTEKVFITKTDTGRINVPNSITGGRCEIETDTGDIKISIK